ncbi:uncharacterized protein JN550_001761 [Neoarthrinium moseri]|uniref:uncharacterized protein n=1 Tax=Neoarthrinium moseri TaxID=1658444 RepID=UPI001FDCE8FE|nr:uncharacterized protein JN550_001761 [Neoarthrinium moseri]KAI1876265.1 hypothetical protein JN550_001761 [Neoarthrinium moseri]
MAGSNPAIYEVRRASAASISGYEVGPSLDRVLHLEQPENRVDVRSVSWKMHSILHGRIGSGSRDLASLLMMEVHAPPEGIQHVQFSMRFTAIDSVEPCPEVVDILHDRTHFGHIHGSTQSSHKAGRSKGLVMWETDGDAVPRLFRPAVLIRRQNNTPFQAICDVTITVAKGFTGKSFTDDPIIFDPATAAPVEWSVAAENLQEFMKDLKLAGQSSAAALMSMSEEGRHCLVSLSAFQQQNLYLYNLTRDLTPEAIQAAQADITKWLDEQDQPRVLWIHGPPGSGKTTLVASLVQKMQNAVKDEETQKIKSLAYHFPSFQEHGTKRASVVLGSLIHQIVLQQPDLVKHVIQWYQESGANDKFFNDHNLLWRSVQQIIEDPEVEPILFIIDALDECDEALLDITRSLNSSQTLGETESHKISSRRDKWMIISRDQQAIEDALSGCFDLDISTRSQSDIEVFIARRVRRLHLDEDTKVSLVRNLVQRANGSFILPSLTLNSLENATTSQVRGMLDTAPLSRSTIVDQLLGQLLGSPQADLQKMVQYILTLVAISFSPLTLSTLSILLEDIYELKISQDRYKSMMDEACQLLVERSLVRLDHGIVLVNQNIREPLFSSVNMANIHQGNTPDMHKSISTRCLAYICHTLAEESKTPSGNSDLLQYPTLYWMRHGSVSSQTVQDVHDIFAENPFFKKNSTIRSMWFTKYWMIKYGLAETQPDNFTMMHMAAEAGYLQLVKVLIETGYKPDVNARDGSERTPLHWAATHGYCEVARLLLDNGADVNVRSADQSSVLHLAIQAGWRDMVQLLLEKGASFETEMLRGARPELKQLLQSHVQLMYKPLPESKRVDNRFWGRIVEIGPSQKCHSKAVRVDGILSPDISFDELMLDGRPQGISKGGDKLLRWIHLPENNMEWVEALMTKCLGSSEATANLLRSKLWGDRVRNSEKHFYSRCLRPVCRNFPPTVSQQGKVMLVIPYLHWGMDKERLMLKNTIHLIKNGDNSLPKSESLIYPSGDKYRELLRNYLDREHPLHIRRTLDQFYYFNLSAEDMELRDKDQTISKYFLGHGKIHSPRNISMGTAQSCDYPMLMVDQLWLWVLKDDTVITSFPHRWVNDGSIDTYNMTDVVAAIERRIMSKAWDIEIDNGIHLAELIANECSGIIFDPAKHKDKWTQTQEIYEDAIGNLANRESSLFRNFSDSLTKARDRGAGGGESERYAINEEIKLLDDIKDIRDELNMIRTIFETQIAAARDPYMFRIFSMLVTNRLGDIARLDQFASRTQEALSHILDLKQKQTNAEEAHFLSVQNIESGKQSRAIMTFTVVTIIFAPLSFLTSFFAIQIVDFPTLTLGFVLQYLFPLGFAVVFICCILAFLNILKEWFTKLRGARNKKRVSTDKEKAV